MALTASDARKVCTKPELELFLASTSKRLADLDSRRLNAKIKRARALRDKWRDLAEKQTRQTKVHTPADLDRANARSQLKAQLFAEALDRFQSRLEQLDSVSPTAPRKKVPAKKRTDQHRATRAVVRDVLKNKRDKLNAEKPAAAKSAKATATASSPAVASKPAPAQPGTAKTAPSKSAKAASKQKSKSAPATSAATFRGKPVAGPQKKRNLNAKTAAKAARVRSSGAVRVQGHTSAQTKRNQAKRNLRKR